MKINKNFCIVGSGRMGETIAQALLNAGITDKNHLLLTDRSEEKLIKLKNKLGVKTSQDNFLSVKSSDIIILCVKPQGAAEILQELNPVLGEHQILISILAGITIKTIEAELNGNVPVIRAMPNTPALIHYGMTAIAKGTFANDMHLELASAIFASVGRVMILNERHFNAVTGLSASGPAFIYVVIESLAEGGVKCGLPRDVSTELAAQMTLGAAHMIMETGQHPAILKDHVTTPAGCTIDGLLKLEEGGLRVTLIKAVTEATKRAGELG